MGFNVSGLRFAECEKLCLFAYGRLSACCGVGGVVCSSCAVRRNRLLTRQLRSRRRADCRHHPCHTSLEFPCDDRRECDSAVDLDKGFGDELEGCCGSWRGGWGGCCCVHKQPVSRKTSSSSALCWLLARGIPSPDGFPPLNQGGIVTVGHQPFQRHNGSDGNGQKHHLRHQEWPS